MNESLSVRAANVLDDAIGIPFTKNRVRKAILFNQLYIGSHRQLGTKTFVELCKWSGLKCEYNIDTRRYDVSE